MRVVVADDVADTRDHIIKLISLEPDIEVVGTAATGHEAVDAGLTLRPDVVLMDVNMPGMDGIEATEHLSRRMPNTAIVMISIQSDADYLRRSMLAGAREFLVKPFGADELIASLRAVHERNNRGTEPVPVGPGKTDAPSTAERGGTVVALFSAKGGVGRTTLAVNLAVAAASEMRKSVTLVDASLQFGDVGLLLELDPKGRSIADVLEDLEAMPEALEGALIRHGSGVKALLPPPSPEVAELVTPKVAREVLDHLRRTHDLVVVDCLPLLQEPGLTILDAADVVLCVVTLDLTSIKNTRLFLRMAERLGYAEGKLKVVLNRMDPAYGITVADVERSIGRRVDHTVVADPRTVVNAQNRGLPFLVSSAQSEISRDVVAVARGLFPELPGDEESLSKQSARPRRLAFARR